MSLFSASGAGNFSSFLLFFRLLMSLPPPLRWSQGVGVQENFSTDAQSGHFDLWRWSKDLSNTWVAEWR